MISGLYSGASALEIFSKQQELISSNLAHLNTPGHRRMLFSLKEQGLASGEQPGVRPGATIDRMTVDFTPGRHETTERALDIAISGEGFFVYQGEQGEVYSRSGVLFRDQAGKLTNGDGLPILSDGAPIILPPDVSNQDIVIDSAGNVSAGANQFGKISVVTFDDNQKLETESGTYFRAGDAVASPFEDMMIMQGTRELSNAHPVSELISLIVGSRHFEAAQRAIRTMSDTVQESMRAA